MRNTDPQIPVRPETARLELVLRAGDGGEWRLILSAGMDRFIGRYPLVDGLGSAGPLLRFRTAHPA